MFPNKSGSLGSKDVPVSLKLSRNNIIISLANTFSIYFYWQRNLPIALTFFTPPLGVFQGNRLYLKRSLKFTKFLTPTNF